MLKTTHVCKVLKATGIQTRMYPATSRMRVECLALSIAFVASESFRATSLSPLSSALCRRHHAILHPTSECAPASDSESHCD
jgi:hypothetical protein